MTRHLLVTNDFPPKVGGIQSYLWELWRRMDAEAVCVYTTPHEGSAVFDAQQDFRVERSPEPWLGPFPHLVRRINSLARDHKAELIIVDPAVPLGMIAPYFELPYAVILHGAEVTVPGRLPGLRQALRRVLQNASFVISAGEYALGEAQRCAGRELRSVVIPPGVDTTRFVPLAPESRLSARAKLDIAEREIVIASVSRLVPRKGMDLLISAVGEAAELVPELRLLIGGTGRVAARLQAQIDNLGAPARLLGRITDAEVAELYGASDLMAMLCVSRWRGLEQEGFGIVFLEAASAGLAQIAGQSGGAAEAVVHQETGLVVDARDSTSVVEAIVRLTTDARLRNKFGVAARRRALEEFDYERLATSLVDAIDSFTGTKGE